MQIDKNKEFRLQPGFVYENQAGESRLVVSIKRSFYEESPDVVIWRTADPELPEKAKSHGSATVSSLIKWAYRARPATREDWNAFAEVSKQREWRKNDGTSIRLIKNRLFANSVTKI